MPLHLMEHPEDVSVVRLPGGEDPAFDWNTGPLASLTRTADETSVVCATASVPRGSRTEGPFRAVEVAGPLDFSAVGVFAEILAPLVDAQISVLGLSTFDTDWVLVPTGRREDAAAAWRRAGFVITPSTLTGGRS
ncbi:ACT domain-containing protein [Phycicoccus avicenniae]|uniref:ACT domain-containing protein n=1 Tax=Phycicoccus avicenniae TaxID=2828860 RepID=UPI003D266C4B